MIDLDEITELKSSEIFNFLTLTPRAEERYPDLLVELSFEVDLGLTMV